jgi:hypothetical protein
MGEERLGVAAEGVDGQQPGERIPPRAVGDARLEARDATMGLSQRASQLVMIAPQEHGRVIGLMEVGIEGVDR